jgi:hypothetical protein
MRLSRFTLALACASLGLSGCASVGGIPASPGQLANKTVVDEQVGITATLAYTAAARAATLAIQTGLIKNPVTIARIKALDSRAYGAVQAIHTAYLAANASGYGTAIEQANAAVSELLASVKGL